MKAEILVRVKPGHRVSEQGILWVGGQTFWVSRDRLPSLMDSVDPVAGVDPKPVHTTAIASPPDLLGPVQMPAPQVRSLKEPRGKPRRKREAE